MSLRLIYGRAGTGKSQYCFNEVKEKINSGNSIFIIVPEQFSYETEKRLLEVLDTNSSVNAEVISFKRMADRLFIEVGGRTKTNLTEAGKAMLVGSILEKQRKNLKFLGKSTNNVDLMLRIITECKKHCINEEAIKEIGDKIEKTYLKMKMSDISQIYYQYQNKLGSQCIDEDDILTMLGDKISQSSMFDNSYIYIDEFSGFTKQEYVIIEQLLKKAKEINITICIDELEETISSENDIYYPNKNVALKLIECAKAVNTDIKTPVNLGNKIKYKSEELKFIEENIYAFPYKRYEKEIKDVKLFLAKNPYSEIENVAKQIIKLVRDENFEFKNIGIITKNIDSYSSMVKAIFKKYEIPVFIDEKSDFSQNILIKFILSILNIFAKNWSHEAVFNYVKTEFCIENKYEIYKLENYCLKWGIKGSKWYKEDWRYGQESANIEELNVIRKKIVEPLLEFKEKIGKEKTVEEITKILYQFLENNQINEKLYNKITKIKEKENENLESEYIASWNVLVNLLDEIVLIFGNETTTFDKYIDILKTGLQFSSLGKIPKTIDEVSFGDVDRSRSSNIKVAFIIGINDGVYPSVNRQEGFLNDKDRETLKGLGIELAKGTIENLYDEQFNIYKAFTTAEEKLYLSYVSSDSAGQSKRPSILITRIKRIFPKIQEKSDIINKEIEISCPKSTFDELLYNIQKFEAGEEIDSKWFEIYTWYLKEDEWKEKLDNSLNAINYMNRPERLNKQNIERLYGDTLKTSVSRLEQYKKCPFSFFLKYGLKVKEKEELAMRPIDTGSFMHDIINSFFERIQDQDIKKITSQEIEKIVISIINEKLSLSKNYIFTSEPRFIALTERLKKVTVLSIKYIVYQLQNSNFKVLGTEVEFKKRIDNLEIEGKIDRIDIAESEEGKFIRVIDYKSSDKDINLNKLMSGIQIQLLTYIDAVSEDKIPAGMLYFQLIDPIVEIDGNLSEEEIEQRIRKEFRMKGLILADVKVAKMMDTTLDKGSSSIIPIYIDSKQKITKVWSNVITSDEFSKLQNTLQKIIKQIANEIYKGNIDIKPTYDKQSKRTECEFCEYKAICNFDSNINEYSYVQKRTDEQILSNL